MTPECHCPSWVIRCVHDDVGVRLLLVDRFRLEPEVRHQWIRPTDKRFYISPNEYDSYAAAQAAFNAAAAELDLLRTDPDTAPANGERGTR